MKYIHPVRRILRALGRDMRNARIRRRIPMALLAERASISRGTLTKIEQGDPSVLMGNYVTVLYVLGLASELEHLASLERDKVGMLLEEERLPKRIRLPRAESFGDSAQTPEIE